MMRPAMALAFLFLMMDSGQAQIVKPQLSPPPCSDPHNCPNYRRGAALSPPGPSQIQKVTCPAGTVFNPKRGTCKVLGAP